MNKCKGCQWHNKPYWSVINPCDNCPSENTNVTIVKIDGEPLFKQYATDENIKITMYEKINFITELEQKDKEIERLNNIMNELEIWLKKICEKEFVFEDGEDYCTERAYGCKECLNKLKELKESSNNE